MNTSIKHFVVCAAISVFVAACGGGSGADDAFKSQKEYDLAVGLWQENNLPGAFHHLFRAVELDPDNAEAHLMLGNLFMMRENPDKAEHHLRRVIAIRKRSPEARNSLGVLYIHQRKFDAAIRELNEATSDILNREPHLAWGNLGWAYLEMGKPREAIAPLLRSVRLEPRFCVGYLRLGQSYYELKDFEEADKALTGGIEAQDKRCLKLQEGWHLRGVVRRALQQNDTALEDFEKCVEIDPDSAVGRTCKRLLDKRS